MTSGVFLESDLLVSGSRYSKIVTFLFSEIGWLARSETLIYGLLRTNKQIVKFYRKMAAQQVRGCFSCWENISYYGIW